MGETATNNILGRIAAAGREERQARAMTLPKALRLTLAKVADALMDLPMAVIGAVVDKIDGEEIEAQLKDDALLILLDGLGGHAGAAVLEPIVVGGLIQQQTMGSVQADSGAVRAMTRTDAAICAPLLDTLFERVCPILDDPDDALLLDGFRFGAKAEDARTLAMALDAQKYVLIRLTVDISRGARQGEIVLVLPLPDVRDAELGEDEPETEQNDVPTMTDTVMCLNANLNMVVCRLHLPLNALQSLAVGDELPLTPGVFPNVQITTNTGRVVGRGVVGHVDGVRAVKPQRKPAHATQPLRRASDEPLVDMPRIEEISGPTRRDEDAVGVPEIDADAGPVALPPVEVPNEMAIGSDAVDEEAIGHADLPALADLPDLDALPDLAEIPDLSDLPDLAAG
ncbi:hypothetical protein [uncultured Tateyamaria sp.]|uniref:hypothetical protein n=1 Tax=uncultured Tateyamaria sp. TaxID=455651 RepID=UPI00261AA3A2|nr:hypothetical protein [uncultured Tateyamaria sp.]